MSRKNKTSDPQQNKSGKKSRVPANQIERTQVISGKNPEVLTQLDALSNLSTNNKVTHLNNNQLPINQQQALAKQIGQVQGNQHLQGILSTQHEQQTNLLTLSNLSTVQRNWLDDAITYGADRIGDALDSRPDEARLDAEEELAQFIEHGEYEILNFHPSTDAGLFDAKYDPNSGQMTITVKVCYKFEPGDPTNPDWINAVGATNAATYTPNQFAWQPGEADQWKQNAKADLESFWSNEYTFHTTKSYWETLPPVNVNVIVDHNAPADGDDAEKAHFVVTVRKWPQDGGVRDEVDYPAKDEDQDTAHFEESSDNGITQPDVNSFSDSTDSQPKYDDAEKNNPKFIFFEQGSDEVSAAGTAALNKFGETLGRPDMPPFPVSVTGRASPEGEEDDNMELAEARAEAVANIIISTTPSPHGFVMTTATGEENTIDYEALYGFFRRVDIEVEDFNSSQTTLRHEFGHMIGLQDQYPDPDNGRQVGDKAGHSDTAEELISGQDAILVHDNEDIMSAGETIKPYHYVTFLEALGEMTNTRGEWNIK